MEKNDESSTAAKKKQYILCIFFFQGTAGAEGHLYEKICLFLVWRILSDTLLMLLFYLSCNLCALPYNIIHVDQSRQLARYYKKKKNGNNNNNNNNFFLPVRVRPRSIYWVPNKYYRTSFRNDIVIII